MQESDQIRHKKKIYVYFMNKVIQLVESLIIKFCKSGLRVEGLKSDRCNEVVCCIWSTRGTVRLWFKNANVHRLVSPEWFLIVYVSYDMIVSVCNI